MLKYVKSQRSYGYLITKELMFGFQILDLKDHFSASLKSLKSMIEEGLFSYSASRDWAGSVVKLLEEQKEKTKQKSELQN